MKKVQLIIINLIFAISCYSQDIIYSNRGEIGCEIKEVTADEIKFTYPGETVMNSIYKNSVQKIVYKSGREQVFSEATNFKIVVSASDWDNVSITHVQSEVMGLFKIRDVSSKAKGTTNLANMERVKERAYRKMKIEAAMAGANLVYITQVATQGNKHGGYWGGSSATETNLSGVAYTNLTPNYEDFVKKVGSKRQFTCFKILSLWSGGSNYRTQGSESKVEVSEIINDGGLIYLKGTVQWIKGSRFRVISFDSEKFVLYCESKSIDYNLYVGF